MYIPRASTQQQAEAARAKLMALADSSGGALISKNVEGIVTGWDDRAEQLFGYRAAEIIGHPMLVITPSDRQAEEAAILEQLRHGQSVGPYATVRKDRGGRRIPVSVTPSPVLEGWGIIEVVRATEAGREKAKVRGGA